MEHRIIHEEAEWLELEKTWRDFLPRAAQHSVFLTPDWLYTWWKHFGCQGGGEPRVVVSYSEGKLVGLLPLCISGNRSHVDDPRRGVLRFMGSTRVCSDFLDGLLDPQARDEVHEGWRQQLQELSEECKAIDLDSGLEGGELDTALTGDWSSYPVDRRQSDICPAIRLPQSFDLFLEGLRATVRAKLRSTRRKLSNEGKVTLQLIETPEEVEAGFATCVDLHQRRRESIGKVGSFSDTDYLAFHREVAQLFALRGWLRILILKLDGRPVASRYTFVYRGHVSDYVLGQEPDMSRFSVGFVLLSYCVETAVERGERMMDLLRGDEPYKFRWAGETRVLWRRRGERLITEHWWARRNEETLKFLKGSVRKTMPQGILKLLGKDN